MSLARLLHQWAERDAERVAIIDGPHRISYGRLSGDVSALAAYLHQHLGLGKGDRVVCVLPNCHEFYVVFYALATLGCAIFPRCSDVPPADALRLTNLRPRAVFVSSAEDLRRFRDLSSDSVVVSVGTVTGGADSYESMLTIGRSCPEPEVGDVGDSDVLAVVFTSGSTGVPKGVQVSARNLLLPSLAIADRLECTANDVFLVPMPLAQMFGIVAGLIVPMICGGRAVLMNRYRPEAALALIAKESVTVHLGVPTMFVRELDLIEESGSSPYRSTLRTGLVAGACSPPSLIRRLQTVMGFGVNIGYGSTETVNISMTAPNDPLEIRATTVGKPSEGCLVKIMSESGVEVATGQTGELYSRGPGTMLGYLDLPIETAQVIDPEGWCRSGDLACVDVDGNIRIVGRCKDLIIRGGNNVAPAEVENVLAAFPGVDEVVVIGVPDRDLGECVIAWLTLREGAVLDEAVVRGKARQLLGHFKGPDAVRIIDAFPRLPGGKVDHHWLQRTYLGELEQSERGQLRDPS